MAAISTKGELYFTCYTGSFTGPVFLAFLQRLTRHLDRKIHLIVDGHPVHGRVMVRDWQAEHVDAKTRASLRTRRSYLRYSLSRPREMIVFWISLVPSPMSRNGASRMSRSISYSLE
jgi:hypothetical protein